jgi:hypothetical protein
LTGKTRFEVLLLDLCVPSDQIAFFDDTPFTVEAARVSGIAAFRVDDFAALTSRLEDLGIINC